MACSQSSLGTYLAYLVTFTALFRFNHSISSRFSSKVIDSQVFCLENKSSCFFSVVNLEKQNAIKTTKSNTSLGLMKFKYNFLAAMSKGTVRLDKKGCRISWEEHLQLLNMEVDGSWWMDRGGWIMLWACVAASGTEIIWLTEERMNSMKYQ